MFNKRSSDPTWICLDEAVKSFDHDSNQPQSPLEPQNDLLSTNRIATHKTSDSVSSSASDVSSDNCSSSSQRSYKQTFQARKNSKTSAMSWIVGGMAKVQEDHLFDVAEEEFHCCGLGMPPLTQDMLDRFAVQREKVLNTIFGS